MSRLQSTVDYLFLMTCVLYDNILIEVFFKRRYFYNYIGKFSAKVPSHIDESCAKKRKNNSI